MAGVRAQNRPFATVIVLFAIYLLLCRAILWKFEIPYIGRARRLRRPIQADPVPAVATTAQQYRSRWLATSSVLSRSSSTLGVVRAHVAGGR